MIARRSRRPGRPVCSPSASSALDGPALRRRSARRTAGRGVARDQARTRSCPLSAVLVVFTLLDLLIGRDQQVLSLLVIAPGGRHGPRPAGDGGLRPGRPGARGPAGHLRPAVRRRRSSPSSSACSAWPSGRVSPSSPARCGWRREEQLARMSAQAATNRAVLQTAETLQRNLLGSPSSVPRLETAVRYRPASRHAHVGGDWYDRSRPPTAGRCWSSGTWPVTTLRRRRPWVW